MADQKPNDLFMKFVGADGPLQGETTSKVDFGRSALSAGFSVQKMFEIASFSLETGLSDNDANAHDKERQDMTDETKEMMKRWAQENKGKMPKMSPKGGHFARFRSMKSLEGNPYPVDMKPIKFEKAVDLSSPLLLDYCINRRPFLNASLAKRRPAGSSASGEIFLRIDFKTVLLTNISWDDGDPIKEKCEFVCRAVCIRYLPQLPDGTLGAAIQRDWSVSDKVTATDIDRK